MQAGWLAVAEKPAAGFQRYAAVISRTSKQATFGRQFIKPTKGGLMKNSEAAQALAAGFSKVLCRTRGVMPQGLRSTLRYLA
jgi:hypothetical protein